MITLDTKFDTRLLPSRRVDAFIHQCLIGPVLYVSRGPFYNGDPVQKFSSAIDSAISLVRLLDKDASIFMSVDFLDGTMFSYAKIVLSDGSVVEGELPGETIAMVLSCLCLSVHMIKEGIATEETVAAQLVSALTSVEKSSWGFYKIEGNHALTCAIEGVVPG